MSSLSILLASNVRGTAPASGAGGEYERGAFAPAAWPEARRAAWAVTPVSSPDEYALPSGVASMEHWLDLNA
jgi:hypothetical protein